MSKTRADTWKRLAHWRRYAQDEKLMAAFKRHPDGPDGARYEAIQNACEAFGLDMESGGDLYLLLEILSDVLFPRLYRTQKALIPEEYRAPKNHGRQEVRTDEFNDLLVARVDAILKGPSPPDNFRGIMQRLKKQYPDDYPQKPATLEKYIRDLRRRFVRRLTK